MPKALTTDDGEHKLDVAVGEPLRQTGTAVFDQLDLDARVAAPVRLKERCEQILDRLRSGPDPQDARLTLFQGAGPFNERIGFAQQSATAPEQVSPFRRQVHAPADTVEKRYAQFDFQRSDLPRDRRLTQIHPGSGAVNAAGVSDGHEG